MDLKRDLRGGEFWANGYYVTTLGERADWAVVERNVKNRGKSKEELCQPTLFYCELVYQQLCIDEYWIFLLADEDSLASKSTDKSIAKALQVGRVSPLPVFADALLSKV